MPRFNGLAVSITEELGRSIVRGNLGPADVLPTEHELTVKYGVSRTVIREAMKALSAKGLLESRTKRGARVLEREHWNPFDGNILDWMEKDEHFCRELIELRRIVEIPAAELASERATPEDIVALESALAAMTEAESKNRPAQFKEADMRLHRQVVRACHNQLIEQLLHVLDPFMDIGFDATIHLLGTGPTAKLHRKLVAAIRNRSAGEARTAMQRIIDQWWSDLHRQGLRSTPHRHSGAAKA